MPCPALLDFQQHGLDAGDVCPLQDYEVVDVVAPVYVQDGAEAVLVEALKELYVVLVDDPRFRAI